ncbi:E3 ubiquitin/ISG15 ligase TRIM25-like [Rhinoderma darwinii]|uniref:E3 ubiquitin/ISG15 ligase TRIM25-like n=1 Tax=Rhinoderma darwinii TaxID=43563 RepID=UPI003F6722AA
MASANLRDELSCSICLNIYKDPVTLKCGHNFCMDCITCVLDTQEGSGVYDCPQCRAQFKKRSALKKNITLCNIVESLHTTQSDEDETGICCTYCIHSHVPAAKCCLLCEAFLCPNHVKVHNKSAEHVLKEPTTVLQKRKCLLHTKVLEYYCMDDVTCICVYCSAGEHRGHHVMKLEEAAEIKKEELRRVLHKLNVKRKETENRIWKLQELRREEQKKAADKMERVAALIRDIKRQLEDLENRVMDVISSQEEQVSLSVFERIQELEIKKDELSSNIHEIEDLCWMTDPVFVLEESDINDFCNGEAGDDQDSEGSVIDVGDPDEGLISEMLNRELSIITCMIKRIDVQEATEILLDVNSAANTIHVSGDLKTATWSEIMQNRPISPGRFGGYKVLSTVSFTSGQLWDVEASKSGGWVIGVCYPSIDRTGEKSYIGNNKKSWGLRCRYNSHQYSVIHDKKEITLPENVSCDKVRICFNYESGQVSFYELCDPKRHIYTFYTTFTEPLHAVFDVFKGFIKILK